MTNEQRKILFDALMGTASKAPEGPILHEFEDITRHDVDVIEPLIDEMLNQAADSLTWNKETGGWDFAVKVCFHSAVQLLAFLRAHEWREPRPGYVNCAECHAEFLATPPASRSHRARCRIAGLINELQTQLVKFEGGKDHAISANQSST